MLDRPAAPQILAAVTRLLKTGAASNFEQRVSANAVSIAAREIVVGPEFEQAEIKRLSALLEQEGSIEDLNAVLCARIRSGDLDWRSSELMEHLRQTAVEKLTIDQPSYPAFRETKE